MESRSPLYWDSIWLRRASFSAAVGNVADMKSPFSDEPAAHPSVVAVVQIEDVGATLGTVGEDLAAADVDGHVLRDPTALVAVEDQVADLQVLVVHDLLAVLVLRAGVDDTVGVPVGTRAADDVVDVVVAAHRVPEHPPRRARAVARLGEVAVEDGHPRADADLAVGLLGVVDLVLVAH